MTERVIRGIGDPRLARNNERATYKGERKIYSNVDDKRVYMSKDHNIGSSVKESDLATQTESSIIRLCS